MNLDFLGLEPLIVARIRAALIDVTPAVHVLTATDLAAVKEASQPVPAVHVLWRGFRVLETRHDGAAARLEHTWAVVTAVRNVRTLGSGADARAEAGALVARVAPALMGWSAPDTAGPMRLAQAPPAAAVAGYFYLPLAFTVEAYFGR